MTKLKPWTDEEVEFLKQNINKMSYAQLAKALGRSHASIRHKVSYLGLIREAEFIINVWDDKKIEFLKKHYLSMTYDELSKHLGISKRSIAKKLTQLGLKKPYIRPSSKPVEEEKKMLTCDDIKCERRKPAGISYGGYDLFYCPVFHITMGKYARPSVKCLEEVKREV
jgi:biotin operon repressor